MVSSQYEILSPPFGFFKKKESSKESNKLKSEEFTNMITLDQASAEVENVISEQTKTLLDRLEPIKESVDDTLDRLSKIVKNLSRENLKTDDKFQSLAENSRRTIVATVMRESSSNIRPPRNLEEAKEFTERLESLLKRFGDASGSHRRVLNEYMKRYSNQMKGEFESLSHLHKKAKELVSGQEVEIKRCMQSLDHIKNLRSQIELDEEEKIKVSRLLQDNEDAELELESLNGQRRSLAATSEYAQASKTLIEIKKIQNEREQLKKEISNMFSSISRAITKYSYGTSKSTYSRLEKMASRPWEIFDEDLGPYFQLLHEIRQEIISERLKLKDSAKVVDYINKIVDALEQLSHDMKQKDEAIFRLESSDATRSHKKLNEIEAEIKIIEQMVSNRKTEVKELERSIEEGGNEISENTVHIEKEILEITGKAYHIKT